MLETLLLAALTAGPSLLAKCQARSWAGAGWDYQCPSRLTARVVDADNAWQVSGAVIARSSTPVVAERRRLAGKWVDVLRSRAEGWTSLFAVVDLDEGGRIVICNAPGEGESCDPVLEVLSRRPWRAGPFEDAVVVAERPLSLRGRPVAVPATCDPSVTPEGGMVSCGTGMVGWVQESLAQAQARADAMRQMVATTTGEDAPEPEMRPCRFAGVRTTCAIWLMKTKDGQVLGASAYVPEGGGALSGFCIAHGGLQLATPPCPLLFAAE